MKAQELDRFRTLFEGAVLLVFESPRGRLVAESYLCPPEDIAESDSAACRLATPISAQPGQWLEIWNTNGELLHECAVPDVH